jgi:hypothetical protein
MQLSALPIKLDRKVSISVLNTLSGRRVLSWGFAGGILFLPGAPIWAEREVFMRAVSFALTGRNDADPKVTV